MFLELCLLPSYCSEGDRLLLTIHQILKDGTWSIAYPAPYIRMGIAEVRKNPAGV